MTYCKKHIQNALVNVEDTKSSLCLVCVQLPLPSKYYDIQITALVTCRGGTLFTSYLTVFTLHDMKNLH